MVADYKFLIFLFLFLQSILRTFCYHLDRKKRTKLFSENHIILKPILIEEYQGPPDDGEPKEKPGPFDKDDIFKEYEKLLEKEKELQQIYDSEYLNYIEKENQLKVDRTYITLLIIISCLLSILIIIFSCYELYKCRRNKKKLNLYKESFSKMNSFGKEFKSSFESSKSTDESNKKNSSSNQSQNGDLNISSNFNIIDKDNFNKKKKEEEIIIEPYNDGDEAPIQFYENNINNNNFNDDMKTLTNDENVYFASKTDKLLYKPYSKDEVNNK